MVYQWVPRGLAIAGAVLMLGSMTLPYWKVHVFAPQYPKGLQLVAYVHRLDGDVRELDILNHYIGMKPLERAAQWERKVSVCIFPALSALLILSALVPCRWIFLFLLPPLCVPLAFCADVLFWLHHYGTHLDPTAPMKIKPFLPPLVGAGTIAQFRAFASFQIGFYLSLVALALAGVGGYLRWKTCPRRVSVVSKEAVPLIVSCLLLVLIGDRAFGLSLQDRIRTASPGETIFVPPGTYYGPIVVTKPVRLIGEGSPVLDGRGTGSVLFVRAAGTLVKGFVIRNSGQSLPDEDAGIVVTAPSCRIEHNRLKDVLFGVVLHRSPGTVLRHNSLSGKKLPLPRRGDLIKVWYSDHVVLSHNRASEGRDVVLWFSKDLKVKKNRVSDSRYGIHFMYCDGADVVDNTVSHNAVGIYLMYSRNVIVRRNLLMENRGPSGYGLGLKDLSDCRITDNLILRNRAGLFAEGVLRSEIRSNYICGNDIGCVVFASSYGNHVRDNAVVENGEQVVVEGTVADRGNFWTSNYWSDYLGYDRDGDGIGETPYRSVRMFESLRERKPALRLFSFSLAEKAIDLAGRLFPIFAPQPRLTDPTPRIVPIDPPFSLPLPNPSPLPLGVLSLLLTASGLYLLRPWVKASDRLQPTETKKEAIGPHPVSVRNLTKCYGAVRALQQVSFDAGAGQIVGLWGPNGAGKTTLFKCLLGLVPYDGSVRIAGSDPLRQPKRVRSLIGHLPQDVRLHPDLTVKQTLSFYGSVRKLSRRRIEEVLERRDLKEVEEKKIGELSGGWRQRVALAIALLSDPPILLLDEPTANLDQASRTEFWSLIRRLKEEGKTILLSSHRSDEVKQLTDTVIVLQQGKVTAYGPTDQLTDIVMEKVCLKLPVANAFRDRAMEILISQGFLASSNDSGIKVFVPSDARAGPIVALTRAGITVETFEMEDGGSPS